MTADGGEILEFPDQGAFRSLCGVEDTHLRVVEERLGVQIRARGNTLRLAGEGHALAVATSAMEQLYELIRQGYPVFAPDVARALRIVSAGRARLAEVLLDTVLVTSGKRRIAPKNLNQKLYIDAIREHDLTFGVGPAGTGKTYLAMAMAVQALVGHAVKRIILTRPAVEAGERLGFLPGDMADKVNPYLRPLYDALYDMLDFGRVQRLMAENAIEVAPLAFMRGRTLNDAFVILDEAQNTTREQMKMFLTRLGFQSKAVVTGDVTQTDLAEPGRSGLVHATHVLRGVRGIAFQRFTAEDVVRHELVTRIVEAYERDTVERDRSPRRTASSHAVARTSSPRSAREEVSAPRATSEEPRGRS